MGFGRIHEKIRQGLAEHLGAEHAEQHAKNRNRHPSDRMARNGSTRKLHARTM